MTQLRQAAYYEKHGSISLTFAPNKFRRGFFSWPRHSLTVVWQFYDEIIAPAMSFRVNKKVSTLILKVKTNSVLLLTLDTGCS